MQLRKKKSNKRSKKKPNKGSKKKSNKRSKKKPNKRSKTPINDGNELQNIFKKLSPDYVEFDKYEKLFIRDMSIKHAPIILYDDIKECLLYQPNTSKTNMGLHIGQRKLLLSEVQFLTKNHIKYCIYAGSAPGHKTHFLSILFPEIKFILIDPNIFNLVIADIPNNSKITHRTHKHDDIIHIFHEYPTGSNIYLNNKNPNAYTKKENADLITFIKNSNHKIFIIEDYMNAKLADLLSNLGKNTFISDIRSGVTGVPNDFDIIWNTSMVYNWINVLKPEYTMVKFRIPYYNKKENLEDWKHVYKDDFVISKKFGTDFLLDYKKHQFKMSKCDLYLQAWKGPTSTEMRGYISKKNINNIVNYNVKTIENKLFYYNKINRICYHKNTNANKILHFCNCNDCAIENTIWVEYIKKFKCKNNIKYYINMTNNITHRPLSKVHNINTYDIIDTAKLKEMSNTENKSTTYKTNVDQKGNKGNIYD